MSVDSGIPDYRGPLPDAQWGASPELTAMYGKTTQELSENATWFQTDPEAAWGCDVSKWLQLLLQAVPHRGYHVLNRWCTRQPDSFFIATSNIDHQHICSGAAPQRVYAMHGEVFGDAERRTVVYQCSFDGRDGMGDCQGGLWTTTVEALREGFDASTGRVREQHLPRCPLCLRPGRPNYLAFKDEFCRVSVFAFSAKREAMVSWLKGLHSSPQASLAILEIGCGTVVRNPRNRTEHEVEQNPNAVLIRINRYEAAVAPGDARQIGLQLPAEQALLALEERLGWSQQPAEIGWGVAVDGAREGAEVEQGVTESKRLEPDPSLDFEVEDWGSSSESDEG